MGVIVKFLLQPIGTWLSNNTCTSFCLSMLHEKIVIIMCLEATYFDAGKIGWHKASSSSLVDLIIIQTSDIQER